MPSTTTKSSKHTISSGNKVLVTGANGYVAVWVVRRFLEKGYAVRGTVRSASKGDFLKDMFGSYGDKFEIAIVDDITAEGAFDECVKGVDAVAHTASPFYFEAGSVDELIAPAVDGTVGILKSAYKNGQGIKRIVILSSVAAILESGVTGKTFTEEDWNEQAINQVKELKDGAPATAKYPASKALAERAAWEMFEKVKGEVSWDISVLNPPYIYGPILHDVKKVEFLNTSMQQWYDAVVSGKTTDKGQLTESVNAWIDVRDVAEAHVLALERVEAGGERIIICAGSYVWQNWIDTAQSLSPSPIPSHPKLPTGYPDSRHASGNPRLTDIFDATKAKKVLGLSEYRSIAVSTRDVLVDFEKRGW